MIGTQLIITNITPEELAQMLKGIVENSLRDELSRFAKEANYATLPPPPLFTVKEVCDALGVSRNALAKWAKVTAGKPAILVPIKMGGAVRYRQSDVFDLLNNAHSKKR